MNTQDTNKLKEALRQKQAQLAEAKSVHEGLVMECNALRYVIDILDRTDSDR